MWAKQINININWCQDRAPPNRLPVSDSWARLPGQSKKVEDMKMEKRFKKYNFRWSEGAETLAQCVTFENIKISLSTFYPAGKGLAETAHFLPKWPFQQVGVTNKVIF